MSGFCIKTGDQAFDYHFTNIETETLGEDGEDEKEYNRHHRLPIKQWIKCRKYILNKYLLKG